MTKFTSGQAVNAPSHKTQFYFVRELPCASFRAGKERAIVRTASGAEYEFYLSELTLTTIKRDWTAAQSAEYDAYFNSTKEGEEVLTITEYFDALKPKTSGSPVKEDLQLNRVYKYEWQEFNGYMTFEAKIMITHKDGKARLYYNSPDSNGWTLHSINLDAQSAFNVACGLFNVEPSVWQ